MVHLDCFDNNDRTNARDLVLYIRLFYVCMLKDSKLQSISDDSVVTWPMDRNSFIVWVSLLSDRSVNSMCSGWAH